jgi:hypothetical protein
MAHGLIEGFNLDDTHIEQCGAVPECAPTAFISRQREMRLPFWEEREPSVAED